MTGKAVAASPAASGPAGPQFEAQVGAHYLLTMLAEGCPRGMPGSTIMRVEFQRAGEGHPLDDVIVKGEVPDGEQTTFEIQVKRTVSFSRADTVFKDVVHQLAQAIEGLDFTSERHQFAVATAKSSTKIAGPYQDVLRWAREVGDAATFVNRVNRKRVGNDDMRNFVDTFRAHLESAFCKSDDETVWQLLRRFQILVFDFDAPGSQSHELAMERARQLLEPSSTLNASGFWKALTDTAMSSDASGGDMDRAGLVERLTNNDGFQIRGSLRNRIPRETIAESAILTVSELNCTIAGISLTRQTQIDTVRSAQESGRYIEITGEPGVGKSGLLGLLAQQILVEGHAFVLTPERTIPGGWLSLKAALGVEVSPKEFLADLASDGGATLFIDSLDFFDDPAKRTTVVDLVRSAAAIPKFQVIVTARTGFDDDEPNWLPEDLISQLGRAPSVEVNELEDGEIEELKDAAPSLRALLSNDHPARAIARNLFRLSRLLEVQGDVDELRSEVDLLERWWTTADGGNVGRRERARLLADLSDAALKGHNSMDTRADAAVVDALLGSKTLREIDLDEVSFHHDVLREWGIAARLKASPSKLETLPLEQSAPSSIVRGVELGARYTLERSDSAESWIAYLERVSPEGAHASWRRWSLLAILRSELSLKLLDRASPQLIENNGALLKELVRTAIAAESRPLSETLSEMGVELGADSSGVFGPSNGSWAKLAYWLLQRHASIPVNVIPDAVRLFQSLSISMFCRGPLSRGIAEVLACWLEEIEDAQHVSPFAKEQPRFAEAFRHHELYRLAKDIRTAFALVAVSNPQRAQRYLRRLAGLKQPEEAIKQLMKFSGSFAEAAPEELAAITFVGLVPKPQEEDRHPFYSRRDKVVTHLDSEFLSHSLSSGPFYKLLEASPQHGLSLIRRLVEHAITVLSDGDSRGDDGITIEFPSGARRFPWLRTYYWSRDADSIFSIETALMALEAWSHQRIEGGDAPEKVLEDILGPEGTPAAFLLIAVDILISHWPQTSGLVVPFLGSPELLSEDRTRQAQDQFRMSAYLHEDGIGPISSAKLNSRISRSVPLERIIGHFVLSNGTDTRSLQDLLEEASQRLGEPEPGDSFAVPRFMARFALNQCDRNNWRQSDEGYYYESPPTEANHIDALQTERVQTQHELDIDAAIYLALNDPSKSSAKLIDEAVTYSKKLQNRSPAEEDLGQLTHAVVSTAMIVARDSDEATFSVHEMWVRHVISQSIENTAPDHIRNAREGIRYNPVSIATLGLVHIWQRSGREEDRDSLLELAGCSDAEAAQGFGAGLETIEKVDRNLVPALLRCALQAQIYIRSNRLPFEAHDEQQEAEQQAKLSEAINAEKQWLNGKSSEPPWPKLPERTPAIRRGIRIGGGGGVQREEKTQPSRSTEQLNVERAALWLGSLTGGSSHKLPAWLPGFISAYSEWTAAANGAGCDPKAELSNRADKWNRVFYSLFVRSLSETPLAVATAKLQRAIDVPDRSFFSIAEDLLIGLDQLHFDGAEIDLASALQLRSQILDRLRSSSGWKRECERSELSVEFGIGPAIGAAFFNYYSSMGGSQCYLTEVGLSQIHPFLKQLTTLIEEGSVPFTAQLTMNLLEVSPDPEFLRFFLSSAKTWLNRQPQSTEIWVDGRLGDRLALWIEKVVSLDEDAAKPSSASRGQINDILASLVQVGVSEANRVEGVLE